MYPLNVIVPEKLNDSQQISTHKFDKIPEISLNESLQVDEMTILNLPLTKKKTKSNRNKLPNKEDLDQYLNESHPRTVYLKPYTCTEICQFKTGWNYFCSSTRQSDSDEYGIGLTLYFRFLKTMIIYFFLFTFISFPQIYFSYQSASQAEGKKYQDTMTITDLLMTTTAGSLGKQGWVCQKNRLDKIWKGEMDSKSTLLKCSSGTLTLDQYQFGIYEQDQYKQGSCSLVEESDIYTDCNIEGTGSQFFLDFQTECQDKTECNFQIKPEYFISDCQYSTFSDQRQSFNAILRIRCADSYIEASSGRIASTQISLVCSLLDLGNVLIMLFGLFLLSYQEKATYKHVKQNQTSISSFTLELTNIPENMNQKELILKLKNFIEKGMNQKFKNLKEVSIADIQMAQSSKFIYFYKERGQALQKRNNLIIRLENQFSLKLQEEVNIQSHKTADQIKKYIDKRVSNNQKLSAFHQIAEIQKLEEKIAKYESFINKEHLDKENTIKSAFITFETLNLRNHAQFLYTPDSIRNCFYWFCGDLCVEDKLLALQKGKLLEAKPAQHPENIIWENYHVTTCQQILRRSVSYLITLILIIITVISIVYLKLIQADLESSYPSVNCDLYSGVTEQQVLTDLAKEDSKIGLLECFCQDDLVKRYEMKFTDGKYHCKQWFSDRLALVGWQFLIVFIILIINEIMKLIFTVLSNFERHKHLSKQLSSRGFKIFFVQFINTALVILIINIQFQPTNKVSSELAIFLNGRFRDTSILWFQRVGTTILLTMFINIFTPILILIVQQSIRFCKVLFDQIMLKPPFVTRKKTQSDMNKYYLGPEFNIEVGYAQVLTVICVCFFYSSGLPLLYFITFITLFFKYWIDKFLFLKVCQKPRQIDKKIANLVRRIIQYMIIIHLLWSIWIYGSPWLFQEANFGSYQEATLNSKTKTGQTVNQYTGGLDSVDQFFQRAFTNQCLPTFIFLILSTIIYVFWPWFITPLLKTIFFFCYSSNSKFFMKLISKGISLNHPFHQLLPISDAQQQRKLILYKLKSEYFEPFRMYLQEKLDKLTAVTLSSSSGQSKVKLSGITSYDVLMNQKYKQFLPDVFEGESNINQI